MLSSSYFFSISPNRRGKAPVSTRQHQTNTRAHTAPPPRQARTTNPDPHPTDPPTTPPLPLPPPPQRTRPSAIFEQRASCWSWAGLGWGGRRGGCGGTRTAGSVGGAFARWGGQSVGWAPHPAWKASSPTPQCPPRSRRDGRRATLHGRRCSLRVGRSGRYGRGGRVGGGRGHVRLSVCSLVSARCGLGAMGGAGGWGGGGRKVT